MEYNFNQCNMDRIQIGGNNNVMNNAPTYNMETLTENDWKYIEQIFEQKLQEIKSGSNSYRFLDESKKYICKRDETSLKNLIKEHSREFFKNIFYNITSTEIIKLLAKIGILI